MILAPENGKNLYKTLVEFGYAEYGSALEMLAASKRAKSSKLKIGYINHAHDEYRHSALIFQVLDNEIKKDKVFFEKEYKFTPQNVVTKGYVDKNGFLIEKLSLKKFVEFIYSNEFLAKQSFENLIRRINDSESLEILNKITQDEENHAHEAQAQHKDFSTFTLNKIMDEEDRHWGFAKKFYTKSFPNSSLTVAYKRETIKNKMRMFYFKNLRFMNKIFNPIINFFILIFGGIAILLNASSSHNKNLMKISSSSIL
jgi:rubrerythrin